MMWGTNARHPIRSSMSDSKDQKKPLVLVLEEDDEFQEFEEADWQEDMEDKQVAQQWQDDWDVDDADDDFCNQLRREMEKAKKQ